MTSIGRDRPADDRPQPGTTSAKSLGVAIAAKTIGGTLFAVLIALSLVALPGPAKDVQTIPCHLKSG
jgi:hypothetical protein